jgi:tetratricopeptide (TPR) repeat protein
MTMVELLDAGLEMLDRQYRGDPRFVGRMLLQMSRRYEDLQNTARQHEVLARAESIARSLNDDELLARANCAKIRSLVDSNDIEEAAARLEEAKRAAARLARPPVGLTIDCLRGQAEILRTGPDPQAARPVLEKARALLESAGSTRGLPYTSTLTDLGYLHFQAGEYREALELNRLVREALERNGRGGTLAMVVTISNQGQLHYRLGEVVQAEELGRESLARVPTLRETQQLPAQSLLCAIALIRMDKAAEAERLLTEATAQARADKNEFLAAITTFQRGRALLELKRYDESAAEFLASETYWKRDLTVNRDRLNDLERSRAELALALGRPDEARARIGALLTGLGYRERRDGALLPAALRAAARIELAGGSPAVAERYARAAVELAETVARDPARSADVGEALLLLGLAQREGKNPSPARGSLERAVVSLTNGLGVGHRLTREAQDALREFA